MSTITSVRRIISGLLIVPGIALMFFGQPSLGFVMLIAGMAIHTNEDSEDSGSENYRSH